MKADCSFELQTLQFAAFSQSCSCGRVLNPSPTAISLEGFYVKSNQRSQHVQSLSLWMFSYECSTSCRDGVADGFPDGITFLPMQSHLFKKGCNATRLFKSVLLLLFEAAVAVTLL